MERLNHEELDSHENFPSEEEIRKLLGRRFKLIRDEEINRSYFALENKNTGKTLTLRFPDFVGGKFITKIEHGPSIDLRNVRTFELLANETRGRQGFRIISEGGTELRMFTREVSALLFLDRSMANVFINFGQLLKEAGGGNEPTIDVG